MSTKCLNIINTLIFTFDIALEKAPEWIKGCYSEYPLQPVINIRYLVSKCQHKINNRIIESDVILHIMKLLKKNTYQFEMLCSGYARKLNLQYQVPQEIIECIDRTCIMDKAIDDKLQDEGRWILTNITSGTPQQTKYIVDNGGIPILMDGIKEKTSISVKVNSIQALGNIAGDNTEYRDLLLSNDILSKLLPLCDDKKDNVISKEQIDLLRCVTWTLSNLCRGDVSPETEFVESMVETLSNMIKKNDTEILVQICWALAYLTNPHSNNVEFQMREIIEYGDGVLDRLIELLHHEKCTVRHPALRVIGNIISNSDEYMEDLIELGILDKLYKLMYDGKKRIKGEACLAVSNITVGSSSHIEMVVKANLFHPLIDILKNQQLDVANEACWAISNAAKVCTDTQIAFLVYIGVISALCEFLRKCNKVNIILIALEGIGNILNAGQRLNKYGSNQFAEDAKKNGCIACLEQIKSNQSFPVDVINKVDEIINNHFNG